MAHSELFVHMMPKQSRQARVPSDAEQAAIQRLFEAYQELKRLGWNDAIYCPKDGTHFESIEVGSTGIHDTNYQGKWPDGSWWIFDGDVWPAHPCLFKMLAAVPQAAPQE